MMMNKQYGLVIAMIAMCSGQPNLFAANTKMHSLEPLQMNLMAKDPTKARR